MNMITRCDNSRCSRIIYKGDSYYKVHMGDFEFELCRNCVELIVGEDEIRESEKMLVQNGIEEDEASTVLQALGYVLLDTELYNERQINMVYRCWSEWFSQGAEYESEF